MAGCRCPPATDCPPIAPCAISTPFNVGATLAPTGRLLTAIEMTSHRCMFDYFKQFSSDDNGRYSAQFDILLGTYCNTLSLIRFLETGLSVACVCTRAPDLLYMREGTVQFEIQQPMIAREGPHPADQPLYTYMVKRVCKRSLSAAFVVAAEALALLSEVSLDGTAISNHLRLRAIQQLARNVRTILDSFERGTVDQMLRILMEKAPPTPLLIPLSRSTTEGRVNGQVMRANLVSELKRRVCNDTFIMSKAGASKDSIVSFLAKMVNSTHQTIAMPRLTHSDSKGRLVDGVLVTTSMVRQKLLSGILDMADTSARVPVTYGEMIISGTNLVTAVVMGKAIRNMDDIARYILNLDENDIIDRTDEVVRGDDDVPQTAEVPAELVTIGDKLIFLEAMERRVYQATQVQYPLIGHIDLTFVMPLGLYQKRADRYARHIGDYAPGPGCQGDVRGFPPRELYFHNKDNQIISVCLSDAIGTVCHSSFLDIEATVSHLRRDRRDLTCVFGAYVTNPPALPLREASRRFFENIGDVLCGSPRWVDECHMSQEQFLSAGNPHLSMELHPAFDFFVVPGDVELPGPHNVPQVMASIAASWRVCNCNIPLPLCSSDFRDALGQELASSRHKMSASTINAVCATFSDVSYPTAFYVIEAVIHGSERNFGILMRLIIQCIRSYWDNCKRVAFVNNFHMVAFIDTYLCSGELPEDCTNIYKELMRHVRALRSIVKDYTVQTDSLTGQSNEELNHALIDRAILPPLLWDCDPLMYQAHGVRDRNLYLNVGSDENYAVRPWLELQDADFERTGNVLVHNRPVGDADRQTFAPHHTHEWSILSKIYYYVMVPAFSRGQCCTMGIRFDNIYATSQSVIIPDIQPDEEPPLGAEDPRHPLNARNLVPNTFNVLLHNARILVDADALLTLQETVNNMAERTTAILYGTTPDVGGTSSATRHMRTFDGALHHGLLMMAYPCNDETIAAGTYFYPVPVNALFACQDHLTAVGELAGNARTLLGRAPPVPQFLGANYYSTFRQPVAQYICESRCGPNEMSYALMAGYFKLTPIGLYHQLRTGFHPGIAFTVVRQDRFLADMGLFAERASESFFLGQVSVSKRPHAGGVQFSLTQPRANVDLGVGYTATCTPLLLRNATTDMGNTVQSLHLTRGSPPLINPEADDFLRKAATRGQRTAPQRTVPFLGTLMPMLPDGLEHGQMSICEFIPTPVSADLEYFRTPCNPRGRAAGAIHSDEEVSDIEKLMYDHRQGDPAYPFRATNNPWASQKFSYADKLYNGTYNLSGASPLFSPTYKFFTPAEVCCKSRCLDKLISEAGSAVAAFASDGEVQFKRPVGSTELIEDPCSLFQEAYPLLCATDKALLRTYFAGGADNPETHLAQYLIKDASPIGGCLPAC